MARNLGARACRVKSFGGKARGQAVRTGPQTKTAALPGPGAKPPKRKRPPFLGGRIEKLFGLFVSRTVGFGAQPAACRFTALGPRGSAWTSKLTFWPSTSGGMPERSTAEMWTKTSLEPSSGAMKPKPLVVLQNFTVPVIKIGGASCRERVCQYV